MRWLMSFHTSGRVLLGPGGCQCAFPATSCPAMNSTTTLEIHAKIDTVHAYQLHCKCRTPRRGELESAGSLPWS